VGYCLPDDTCGAAHPVDPRGMSCEAADECESLNCRSANPDNEFLPPTCLLPALVHDDCGAPYFTVCEEGSYCAGSTCEPGQYLLSGCSSGEECRSGLCQAPVSSYICLGSQACFWAWDEKVPD
jgi:hypothetical protein